MQLANSVEENGHPDYGVGSEDVAARLESRIGAIEMAVDKRGYERGLW
jgi:hypothetical protein